MPPQLRALLFLQPAFDIIQQYCYGKPQLCATAACRRSKEPCSPTAVAGARPFFGKRAAIRAACTEFKCGASELK